MKSTASVRDLRNHFPKVRKILEEKGEVLLTESGKAKYRLLPSSAPPKITARHPRIAVSSHTGQVTSTNKIKPEISFCPNLVQIIRAEIATDARCAEDSTRHSVNFFTPADFSRCPE
jgi:antitoxin (DNA-binding transcriptional repressor) of toxin-antitoxin stability system